VSSEYWSAWRSAVNHDVLGHQFLPALGALINQLKGGRTDARDLCGRVGEVRRRWAEIASDVRELCRSFESEMSPARLVDRGFLANWDGVTREWVGALVHGLWSERVRVKSLLAEAARRLADADAAFSELLAHAERRDGGSGDEESCCLRKCEEAYRKCDALSEVLSRFPRETRLV